MKKIFYLFLFIFIASLISLSFKFNNDLDHDIPKVYGPSNNKNNKLVNSNNNDNNDIDIDIYENEYNDIKNYNKGKLKENKINLEINDLNIKNNIKKPSKKQMKKNQNDPKYIEKLIDEKNIYFNKERLNQANIDGNGEKNKIPQHENYLKKQRTPRPLGNLKKNKIETSNKTVGGSGSGNEKSILINKNVELSISKLKCENGGIGFAGKCICPFAFSGTSCEIIDPNEKCASAVDNELNQMKPMYGFDQSEISSIDTCTSSPKSICCWSKYRTMNKISTSPLKDYIDQEEEELNQQNNEIKSILTNYGPWEENDKKMLEYLIESSDGTDSNYKLKYHSNQFLNKHKDHENHKKPKIAFVLLIHKVDLEAIKLLFNQIYKTKHYYVIHVDNRYNDIDGLNSLKNYSNEIYLSKINNSKVLHNQYPHNIEILESRFNGLWGSISLVYAEVASYTKLFDMVEKRNSITGKSEKWSHVVNLSINDFPIKTIDKLEKLFSNNLNLNYLNQDYYQKDAIRYNMSWVQCNTITNSPGRTLTGFQFFNDKDKEVCGETGIEKTIDRSLYKEGSQWKMITFKFAYYVVSNFKAINRLFSMKFTYIPDESYFQITKSESLFANETSEWDISNLRYIPWQNSALTVSLQDVENNFNNEIWNYFTRKVYSTDVKNEIIKKFLKD